MSATVTYKGSTLTTVDNTTKTLKTAGMYMEGDVVITDTGGGGGGATNFVTGTFTTQSGTGAQSVTIPYTGSGYPIAAMVFVEGGAYNSAISGWYSLARQYAVGQWTMSKSVTTSAPNYSGATSLAANQAVVTAVYKQNSTASGSYTRNSAMNTGVFTTSNAQGAVLNCVVFKSSTNMSVYVSGGSTARGLVNNLEYRYIIYYSE